MYKLIKRKHAMHSSNVTIVTNKDLILDPSKPAYIVKTPQLNIQQLKDITLADVFMYDYPDFCDAYVESATFNNVELTEEQLDVLNDQDDTRMYVNENAYESLMD